MILTPDDKAILRHRIRTKLLDNRDNKREQRLSDVAIEVFEVWLAEKKP